MESKNWFEKNYITSRIIGLIINLTGCLLTDKGIDFIAGTLMLFGFLMLIGIIKFNISGDGITNTQILDEEVNPLKQKNSSDKTRSSTIHRFQYQSAGNIHLISRGGYVLKSNSNYYNLLMFEPGGICKKANIDKNQERNPGGLIFLTLLNATMNLDGNKGFWSFNAEKNELLIKFNIDKRHEQTFRCKLRADGTLVVNVFFKDEDSNKIRKEIREYYFDSNFEIKFIL